MFTEQRDLLGDAVDIYDGPQWTANAEPTMEENGLSIIDAVENPPMTIGPERQHIILQGQSLRQSFGPVAGSCHQVRASILGDVGSNQFARVQAGETKAKSSTPASVDTGQTKTHLNEEK